MFKMIKQYIYLILFVSMFVLDFLTPTNNISRYVGTRGGLHDHPSSLYALCKIRMILLGKNPGITQSHMKVELQPEEIKEEFLLAKAKMINFTVTEPLGNEEIPDDSSSTSTCTTSAASRSGRASESDELIYLPGFLAKQNLTKHPYLGTFTHTTKDLTFHTYAMPSWLQSLSFGGLIEPSSEWLSRVKIMEKYYQKYHKQQFQEGKNIIKRTTEYTKKMNKPNIITDELISAFSRQRVFVRIKYLNAKKEKMMLRKRKLSIDKSTKRTKKNETNNVINILLPLSYLLFFPHL
jgi:hypothetical protein